MLFRRTVLTLVAALVATACGKSGKDATAPDTSYVGSYSLASIDGDPVPLILVFQPSLIVTLESGSLALDANQIFTETTTRRSIVAGVTQPAQQLICRGTYVKIDNILTLTALGPDCVGTTLLGTFDGDSVAITDGSGEKLVFRR